MAKKKKKNLTLPILLAVLVALGGSYAAIRAYNRAAEAKEDEKKEQESGEEIAIFGELAEDEITALSYDYQGETLSFVKDGDTWYLKEDREIPLSQTKFSAMTGVLSGLRANRVVEESLENLSSYGLDVPAKTISFETANGSHTIYVGDQNPITNDYYFYLEGENKVYTTKASISSSFQSGLSAFYTAPSLPQWDQSNLQLIEIAKQDGNLAVMNLPNGDPSVDYMGGNTWFVSGEDGKRMVMDAEAKSTFLDKVTGLSLGNCVDYKPAKESLKTYGLEEPTARISIRYTETREEPIEESGEETGETEQTGETEETGGTEETDEIEAASASEESETPAVRIVEEEKILVLTIGGKNEDGKYYVQTSGASQVCLMDAAVVEYFLNLKPADFTNLSACMVNISTVERLVLQSEGQTVEMAISLEEKPNEDSDTTATVETFYINGAETEEQEFKSAYQKIIALKGEQVLDPEAAVKGVSPELTITFYRDTVENREVSFELVPYDSSFYQLSINGTPSLLVNKFDVSGLKELVSQLAGQE